MHLGVDSADSNSTKDPFGSIFPPSQDGNSDEWYDTYLLGTYRSNWDYLRGASASSFRCACRGVGEALDIWGRGLFAEVDRIDLSAEVAMAWMIHASGPLLASTQMPMFALEALTRYCAEIALNHLGDGEANITEKLKQFDRSNLMSRLRILHTFGVYGPLPRKLKDEIHSLSEFRNASVHDRPLMRARKYTFVQNADGQRMKVDPRTVKATAYPRLSMGITPLRLQHAIRATAVHDALVDHFEHTASSGVWDSFTKSFGPIRVSSIRIADSGSDFWDEAVRIDDLWGDYLEWDLTISLESREARVREHLARAAAGIVK